MKNSEIELELLNKYGLEKTILYCEMTSYMYGLMYEDIMEVQPKLNLDFAFDYEANWWKEKHDELIKIMERK